MNKQSTKEPVQPIVISAMTADRAKFFLRRFKGDEKMLGPNEQAALDFAIEKLSGPVQPAGAQGEPVAKAVSGKREVSCHGPNRKYVDGVVLVQLQELEPETLLYSAPPAAAINEQLLNAAKNVLRNETEDGWFISTVDCHSLKTAIAAAEAEKAKGGV